jgi:hypothetical protein
MWIFDTFDELTSTSSARTWRAKSKMLKVEKEKIIREQNYFELTPLLTVIVLTKTVPVRSMISAG